MKVNPNILEALRMTSTAYRKNNKLSFRDDPNWSDWYANYLLSSTQFPMHTTRNWTKDDLATALLDLYSAYKSTTPNDHWAEYYAKRLDS